MTTVIKETRAQRQERIKNAQNPWQELPRLLASLRGGLENVAEDDLQVRLRWWGLYTQGDGAGAFGGAAPYFMLRVRLPNGKLSAVQLEALASICDRYARGVADITTRQNIQLHWLQAEELPELFARLDAVGITSQAACGDDPRNLTGCPLAGCDPNELVDASPLLFEINRALLADGSLANLPRKFKLCVSGCREWCPQPEINDAGFTARRLGDRLGFSLRVGGGLSATPHLAQWLPVWLQPEEVVPAAQAIAALYRDRHELRQNRAKARLKFLFLEHGWTVERFRAEIETRMGRRLADAPPEPSPRAGFRDHLGLQPQKQPGYYWAGVSVLRGRISAGQMLAVARAAQDYAGGEIRLTGMQNLIVPHVPEAQVAKLRQALEAAGLPLAASAFRRGVVACTGKEFCKLAVTETKAFAAMLAGDLERRLPEYPEPLSINVNGCPNSCGQHWIADIGLQGVRVKAAQGAADGFDVFLGGGLGENAGFARKTLGRVAAVEIAPRLESLLKFFLDHRLADERFREFSRRWPPSELAACLGTLPLVPSDLISPQALAAAAQRQE